MKEMRRLKDRGFRNTMFCFPFLTKKNSTSWRKEEDLGTGGIERVLLLARSASGIETSSWCSLLRV